MKKIIVIDYGMGNLHSVAKALEKASRPLNGFEIIVTNDEEIIKSAQALVLPGVGAFAKGIENLKKLRLIPIVRDSISNGKPFLGICLGFQILFSESEEHGPVKGLNILEGKVVRFPENLKVPHMGWNQIKIKNEKSKIKIFKNIPNNSFFYFVHSYYVVPKEKEIISAITKYGVEFASAIEKNNIYGVQFHPEKSQNLGLKLLENFINIIKEF
jgi:glutamine amidotransferase